MDYSRSLSSSNRKTNTNFYLTTLHPPSFYSPKRLPIYQPLGRTYTTDYSPANKDKEKDYNNIYNEKSINIFRSNINKSKASPFYNNEKSLRIQDEIDLLNKLISGKTKINKLVETNSKNNLIKKEEDEISELLRSKIRIEKLNNIYNDINNRSRPINFNYIRTNFDYNSNPYPFNSNRKYKNRRLFTKNSSDIYNHRNFMTQMINFKNEGINKWKNDFKNKFNEY